MKDQINRRLNRQLRREGIDQEPRAEALGISLRKLQDWDQQDKKADPCGMGNHLWYTVSDWTLSPSEIRGIFTSQEFCRDCGIERDSRILTNL